MKIFLFFTLLFALFSSFTAQSATLYRYDLNSSSYPQVSEAAACDWGLANGSHGGWPVVSYTIADTSNYSLSGFFSNRLCEFRVADNSIKSTKRIFQKTDSCPAGYDEVDGFCVEPDPCIPKQGTSEPVSFYPSGTPTTVCNSSCTASMECTIDSWTIVEDGVDKVYRECSPKYYNDSSTCTGSDELSFTQLPEDSCAAGQSIGDVNGQTICVNADGSVEDTRPNTITNENTSTTYSEVTNPDGSKTQTKTTSKTKSDGTSSTSTTVTNIDPNGNVTDETTDTEEEEKESTYTDSGCDAPPVCKGDAIQCAIAHNTWNTDCFFSTDASNITEDGLGIPVEDRTNEVGDTIDVSNVLDTTSFLADTCPAPRTINVAYGSTMTLDYAPLCDIADIIGSVILISASIISIRIIGGGF